MYGVKLYAVPENLDETINLWHKMNFDTLFIGQDCKKDTAFLKRLQQEKFFVNLIEPVFLADESVDEKFLAITKTGQPAKDSWVRFVCPSNKKWLSSFFKRLKEDSKLPVNSLSLDFLRFFQFWEVINPEDKNTVLTETCYCKKCKRKMRWFPSETKWRCSVINRVASISRKIISKNSPDKKLGIHIVPWKQNVFTNGASRILGQNLKQLKKYADFFTPMTYHHMIFQTPEYIRSVLEDFKNQTSKQIDIIPSVQLKKYYRDEEISISEATRTVITALDAGNKNVIYFQWNDINENEELKNLLINFASKKNEE